MLFLGTALAFLLFMLVSGRLLSGDQVPGKSEALQIAAQIIHVTLWAFGTLAGSM